MPPSCSNIEQQAVKHNKQDKPKRTNLIRLIRSTEEQNHTAPTTAHPAPKKQRPSSIKRPCQTIPQTGESQRKKHNDPQNSPRSDITHILTTHPLLLPVTHHTNTRAPPTMAAKFIPRQVFPSHASIPRSYFLGHHRAGLKKMQNMLSSIDYVVECRDYRVPATSVNPLFEEALGKTRRLVVYTKRDLGSKPGRGRQEVSLSCYCSKNREMKEYADSAG